MVVREYLHGPLGFKLLARKHDIKSHRQLNNWVNVYKKYGAEGLRRKKNAEVYSVKFKLDVLSFMKRTGASLAETALHFGLTNPSMIASWKRKLLKHGVEALNRPRGRPAMSDKVKNEKNKKHQENNEMTREQKLEQENELLRLEVEYLKKLRAFQMDPEGYLEKHKQLYHSSSKKNSD
ncbi:helix-turn-helix domain-containing protein [Sporosarcina beigongshangi]|uniref:helix-turn-helix domain-containing protein n=1 Tax=Sporosarcina beigongshangi TaxID=2782538 RepID=UPI001E3F863E|nr:helix-turn-helix domain-containing protein [Sporosarcina beigongshangi]